VSDGHLTIEVTDDGVGGAGTHGDGALAALSDRIAALGGTLQVISPPSRGTRLEARLPLSATREDVDRPDAVPPLDELDRVAEDRRD
jgi:glucose-6-phosphate-specific signal transduction histidine kinase